MNRVRAVFAVPGDLMTLTGGYHYDRSLMAALEALGHPVEHLALPGTFPHPSQSDLQHTRQLLTAVTGDSALVIDGLALGAMTPDTLDGVRAPLVALIHHPLAEESGLSAARRAALQASEQTILQHVTHTVVTSPHTAALLQSRYHVSPDQVTIARPGVDTTRTPPTPIDPPLILSVGIAVPRKGHDVLIQALASITDRPWQAVIVGEARDRDYARTLSQRIESAGLSKRVRLAGRVTDENLARLYGEASVFALATRYEGYGIVFDEAMVNGLPIVSCAVGAVPDTVAAGAGRLVPADDPAAFAAALSTVLDDAVQRTAMAAASQQAGRQLPRWEDTAGTVADVLRKVVPLD